MALPCIWVTALILAPIVLHPLICSAADASPLGSEYIGIGAPLFPVEPGNAATCYEYFFALTESNCTTFNSETLPVRLHNCVNDGASGVLVLERTTDPNLNPTEVTSTTTYRLRVAGPDGLWLLEPTYCRPDLALASYELRHPGLFSVEVLMLYTSFSFIQPNSSKACQSPWAGYLTLDVQIGPSWTLPLVADSNHTDSVYLAAQHWTRLPEDSILHSYSTQHNSAGYRSRHPHFEDQAFLPLCPDTGPTPGRWHFAEWPPASTTAASAAAALLRTCIWYHPLGGDADCSDPQRRPLRYDSHPAALSWQPYGCRMRTFAGIPPSPPAAAAAVPLPSPPPPSPPPPPPPRAPITPGSCLPPGRRRVCFVGDSHSRYLQNSLVLWQRGFHVTVNNTQKELLPSDSVRYEYMRWGHDWPGRDDVSDGAAAAAAADPAADPLVSANCTDIIANFGQWPASYRSGSAPYSALQYLRQLLRVRRGLLAARRARGVRVFWLTTCMSSLKAELEAAGADWRTDPLLTLYNRLAVDVMGGELPTALSRMMSSRLTTVTPTGSRPQRQEGTAARDQGTESPLKVDTAVQDVRKVDAGGGGGSDMGFLGLGSDGRSTEGAEQHQQRQRRRRRSSVKVQQHQPQAQQREQGDKEGGSEGGREQLAEQEKQRLAFLRNKKGWRIGDNKAKSRRGRSSNTSTTSSSSSSRRTSPPRRPPLPSSSSSSPSSSSSSSSLGILLGWLKHVFPSQHNRRRLLMLLGDEIPLAAAAAAAAEDDDDEALVQPNAAGAAAAAGSLPPAPPPLEAIPVIDTWSLSRILHDTTWDGVHYSNTGAVGLAQLVAVLHALCSDAVLEELAGG